MKNNNNLENLPAISEKLFFLPYTAEWFFRDLTNEEAGKLIKDLLAYHNRGVKKKYATSNKIGLYFHQIVWDTEDQLNYYKSKGLL